jgi:hypothetical protein
VAKLKSSTAIAPNTSITNCLSKVARVMIPISTFKKLLLLPR